MWHYTWKYILTFSTYFLSSAFLSSLALWRRPWVHAKILAMGLVLVSLPCKIQKDKFQCIAGQNERTKYLQYKMAYIWSWKQNKLKGADGNLGTKGDGKVKVQSVMENLLDMIEYVKIWRYYQTDDIWEKENQWQCHNKTNILSTKKLHWPGVLSGTLFSKKATNS